LADRFSLGLKRGDLLVDGFEGTAGFPGCHVAEYLKKMESEAYVFPYAEFALPGSSTNGIDDMTAIRNKEARALNESPDQQDDSAYRVAGSPSEPHDCEHVAAKQEVGHGAEQGSVPEGAVDAGVLRSIRLGAAV
jgi:hypothetical protein